MNAQCVCAVRAQADGNTSSRGEMFGRKVAGQCAVRCAVYSPGRRLAGGEYRPLLDVVEMLTCHNDVTPFEVVAPKLPFGSAIKFTPFAVQRQLLLR